MGAGGFSMADDPSKRGKPDRDRVSQQPHEIKHLEKKFDLPPPLIRKVVQQEGPKRQNIERYLDRMKRNGR
jgi:hypothetical protein